MKLYTTQDQTTRLIDLGFEKPKSEVKEQTFDDWYIRTAYSIGELLSFLPLTIQWTPRVIKGSTIEYSFETEGSELYYCNAHNELIDNLFDMCILLKEEGVI